MNIAIVEGGGANFLSVTTALERLGINYRFTKDAKIIQNADAVLLPGVGTAGFAMRALIESELDKVIPNLTMPVLGICLGMQLLYEYSEEDNVSCLGIIPGRVRKFNSNQELIVPHMGWNNLLLRSDDMITDGVTNKDNVYFVHSYYAPINQATIASCDYGFEFTALTKHNNFYGMQFHPEKSGSIGAKLLANFFALVKGV